MSSSRCIVSLGELEGDLRECVQQDLTVEKVLLDKKRSIRHICYKYYANCAKSGMNTPLFYLTKDAYDQFLSEVEGAIEKKVCEGTWYIMHFSGEGSLRRGLTGYSFDEMYFIKERKEGKYHVIEAYIRHDSNVNWTDCFINRNLLFECFPKIVKDKFDGIQVEIGAIVLEPSRIMIIDKEVE